ncbi:hypothetical protein [Bailinhaonella thermotolerans]|uniref:Uncharacterized protein n=1 Tax=Bailinhaonella thermotolerans TaxID=1070861 RepID=A0A3A4APF3_9ACTN|nr:hypothetical protein [Bailinhaonella thermotolerans]RJL21219.1 hypothetical protein D5H75_37775 [Bailinhaonella thermotolerans]
MGNLSAIRTTRDMVEHAGAGDEAAMMKYLGLWTAQAHSRPAQRRPFAADMASLAGSALADEQAWWTSELGRVLELIGVLEARKVQCELTLKRAKASARAAIRRTHQAAAQERAKEDGTPVKVAKLTVGELNDWADETQPVREAEESKAEVEAMLAMLAGVQRATEMYLSTLSREITRRGQELQLR